MAPCAAMCFTICWRRHSFWRHRWQASLTTLSTATPRPRSGSASPGSSRPDFSGLLIVLGGHWLRVLVTAGLLTVFVDLQFEWLDPPTYLRGLCLGSGMLLLCWLLREHLNDITAPVFATMLAAAVLFPDGSGEWSAKARAPRVDARGMARPAPPVVVHLIFDEFIGIEGIPSEVPHGIAVARSLRSFLHQAGFHVFGRAYSRFDRTENSIPNILNYVSVPEQRHFHKGSQRRLDENRYFRDMHKRGYAIHVYQPDYMDFCAGHESEISSCQTFPTFGINGLHMLQFPALTKAELVIGTFSNSQRFGERSGRRP